MITTIIVAAVPLSGLAGYALADATKAVRRRHAARPRPPAAVRRPKESAA